MNHEGTKDTKKGADDWVKGRAEPSADNIRSARLSSFFVFFVP
jgi:hypothetical protein